LGRGAGTLLDPGSLTYIDAAAPPETLHAFLWLVSAGALLLVPSLGLLFRFFKSALPGPS
jgi:cytochrome bd-type quinol oxidase subunit 2